MQSEDPPLQILTVQKFIKMCGLLAWLSFRPNIFQMQVTKLRFIK